MENIINKLVIIAVIVLASLVLIRLFWSRLYEKVKAFKEAFNKVSKVKDGSTTIADSDKGGSTAIADSDKDGSTAIADNDKEAATEEQILDYISQEAADAKLAVERRKLAYLKAIERASEIDKANIDAQARQKARDHEALVRKFLADLKEAERPLTDYEVGKKTTTRTVAKIKKKKGGDQ